MFFFGLLLIGTEFLYSAHGLQIQNIDLDEILENVHQKGPNRGRASLKDDRDDLTHFIQKLDFDNDNRASSLKKYESLDRYGKDGIYNNNENLSHLLKSLINEYNNKYNHKVKKNSGLNKKVSQKFHELMPSGSNDYSKLYVILNPKVDLPRSAAQDLANLISSLFPKYGSKKKSEISDHSRKLQRYKGFAIRDSRRRIKESKEKFALKDSMERDYKPKRGRSDYGGGGRTAIPYIRHRGDIYERE